MSLLFINNKLSSQSVAVFVKTAILPITFIENLSGILKENKKLIGYKRIYIK